MDDYVEFRRMIAPAIIQILFWISVLACIGLGIWLIASAHETNPSYYGGGSTWNGAHIGAGATLIIVGPLVSRLASEFYIVVFRIYETLDDIASSLEPEEDEESEI